MRQKIANKFSDDAKAILRDVDNSARTKVSLMQNKTDAEWSEGLQNNTILVPWTANLNYPLSKRNLENMELNLNLLQFADFSRKVLVIGEIHLEISKECTASRIAAEAPVPVSYESGTTYNIGGAAVVADNLLAMGIDVDLVTCIGTLDEHLNECIKKEKLRTDHFIACDGYAVAVNTKYVTEGYLCFQSLKKQGAQHTPREVEDKVLKKCKDLVKESKYSAVIVMHSHDGFMSGSLLTGVLDIAKSSNISSIITTNSADIEQFKGVSVVLIDKKTILSLSKNYKDCEDINGLCKDLHQKLDIRIALLVFSQTEISMYHTDEGNIVFHKDVMPSSMKADRFTTAEHVVVASVGFGVACNMSVPQIAAVTSRCVDRVARNEQCSTVRLTEVLFTNVITTKAELVNFSALLPRNKTIVVTTGCFDLLHALHVTTLKLAKAEGDILIVLLNTDKSVRELKGQSRPIYPLEERLVLLQSVKYVDFIVLLDDTSPYWHLQTIDPDVFVKGDDYTVDYLSGRFPFVKKCKIVLPGLKRSTTGTIKRILETYSNGSSQ